MSFDVKDGEFLVILGPSGCGKTTALRCIAGLLEPTSGEIYIDGRKVNGVYPSERNIAMVFQNYALYPHMTVYDNIALNMRMKHIPSNVIDERVRSVAQKLRIDMILRQKPRELSGGQAQRVGLARAMVREPSAFLMDEPLSNLDAKLRNEMRDEMKRFRSITGKSIVYVTHDQIEAMTLGDRIIVMNKGKIIQEDSPKELFDDPDHVFVASFLGNPPMNMMPFEAVPNGVGSYKLEMKDVAGRKGKLEVDGTEKLPGSIIVGVRPTDFSYSGDGNILATFDYSELLGAEVNVHFHVGSCQEIARIDRKNNSDELLKLSSGMQLHLEVPPERVHIFDGDTQKRIRVRVSDFSF
ncbi:MAG: ABC transporter ATP-binding protein [Methanomassiliicoccales archaeon]